MAKLRMMCNLLFLSREHLPIVQDLCGERQRHSDRAMRTSVVYAVFECVAGGFGRPGKEPPRGVHLSLMSSTDSIYLPNLCRGVRSAGQKLRGQNRSWWTPSTRVSSTIATRRMTNNRTWMMRIQRYCERYPYLLMCLCTLFVVAVGATTIPAKTKLRALTLYTTTTNTTHKYTSPQ